MSDIEKRIGALEQRENIKAETLLVLRKDDETNEDAIARHRSEYGECREHYAIVLVLTDDDMRL